MPDEGDIAKVVERLRGGLSQGSLAPAVARHGQQLLERLENRVQVVVFGLPESGKTSLRQVLLQQATTNRETHNTSRFSQTAPATETEGMRDVQCASSFLEHIDLVDTHFQELAPSDITQVFAKADVVLWCTQTFSEAEAEIWDKAPDHLKDHSFLVLTKADALAKQDLLQSQISHLTGVAAEEFHSLFPTTCLQAVEMLSRDNRIDAATRSASGVAALVTAVCKLAAEGRRADMDSALLFLERHNIASDSAVVNPASTVAPATEMPTQPTATNDNSTYGAALALVRTHAREFHAPSDFKSPGVIPELLSQCILVSDELAELVASNPGTDPDYVHWCDDIFEAADKITLMSMEDTVTAAADAIGIIAQIRVELEARANH